MKAKLADYALAWKNIKDEKCAGRSFRHDPDEGATNLMRGIGNHNVQLLFLNPKGELLHALAGYWSAKDLAHELELVAKLAKAESKEKVVELHAEHAKADAEALGTGGCGLVDKKTMKWLEDTQ